MNSSPRLSDAKHMKHVIARAIACGLMLLVLPSCGIPPLRKAEPARGLPESFNGGTSADNSSQLGIDDFYRDPMLACLVHLALASNRELKILEQDVQIANNEVLARSGQYLPFISVGAGAGLQRASRFTLEGAGIINDPYLPGKRFSLAHGDFNGGLNLTWQLDIYRQLRNARDAAGQRSLAAIERRNYFVTQLVAEVAENYYRLVGLDKRIENLDQTIELQQRSLEIAEARKAAALGTQLSVLRFQSEVRRNQSEKLIVNQDIIESENRVNFLVNRYPEPVQRVSAADFFNLEINSLSLGVPSQLLQNRPDIRQAERELTAAGLDVKVARVNFFPQLVLNAGTGLDSYLINRVFEPQAVIGDVMAGLVGPFVNKRAIRAQYLTANARQSQAIYNYQRVILNAFTEVINRMSMVQNYSNSIKLKKQQLDALDNAVQVAGQLFRNANIEYLDVLIAQRDLRDARTVLIDTKTQQLSAVIHVYQALGGGLLANSTGVGNAYTHTVSGGENFETIALLYYKSGRYSKALWAANKGAIPAPDRLTVGAKIIIPRIDQLDPALIEGGPAPAPPIPDAVPADKPAIPPPPPASVPGPFGQKGTDDPAVKATGGTRSPEASPKPATTAK